MPPALLCFIRIALDIQGVSWLYINFRIVSSISVKNDTGILIAVALNLYITLDSVKKQTSTE